MANALKLLPFLIVLLALIMTSVSLARPLALEMTPKQSLIAGVKLDEESPSCWESLRQLQPCAGEVVNQGIRIEVSWQRTYLPARPWNRKKSGSKLEYSTGGALVGSHLTELVMQTKETDKISHLMALLPTQGANGFQGKCAA
ncbi:egg cell-secreted protein 1.1-like protein [Corchorus capsularis]|uniref:Egg cell-secreted protein 1.1-like protein n=1 Tax=Corchorus capsularis TaxID=210143 RepID=A0A1R3G9U9_COCAP|nr:egg cell-secreted protein 1.1-like protein [Corchorus capsularis]